MTSPSDNAVTFRPEDHTYWWQGTSGIQRVPSVSEILDVTYPVKYVSPERLNALAELGTAVHSAISEYVTDVMDRGFWLPVDPQRRYDIPDEYQTAGRVGVEKFRGIAVLREWEPVASETIVYCSEHGYAGTLDLVVKDGHAEMVVDLKSGSSHSERHIAQVGAYSLGWAQRPSRQSDLAAVLYLRLRRGGFAKLETVKVAYAQGLFLDALAAYREVHNG